METSPLWYPYVQMKHLTVHGEVTHGDGVYIHLADGRVLIDAISSWWCTIHGYNHPEINEAAKAQIDRISHVMLGGLITAPARDLAKALIRITPPSLQHVFFGDSGSVGVEIALKMALQYWVNLNDTKKNKFVALTNAYHGDTSGCMSVCDPQSGMHALFSGLLPEEFFVSPPTGGLDAGDDEIQTAINQLEQLFKTHHATIAAMIVEPLFQGAGGFQLYSPTYLQKVRTLCDQYQILLIFDEVATGFGRLGKMFAADIAKVEPDIMVLGKGLTAGYLGHSATIASHKVFMAFYNNEASNAFMHGPTFMGNPLSCAIALKSLEIFERDDYLSKIKHIESVLHEELDDFSSQKIKAIRIQGAMAVIELHKKSDAVGIQEFGLMNGVWLRPYLNYIYTMPPYIITDDQLRQITCVMKQWLMDL